jgi:hypothetical protein
MLLTGPQSKEPHGIALCMKDPSLLCCCASVAAAAAADVLLHLCHRAILLPADCSIMPRAQIGAERARTLELQEGLAALRARVAAQRRAMGGVNAAREGDLQARQGVKYLPSL